MREKIIQVMPALFDVVLEGFSVSAVSTNKEVLRASERHLFLFVQLCEWAQGTKTLSACGIKTTTARRENIASHTDTLPTLALNGAVQNGIGVALQSYDKTIADLHAVIHAEVLDYVVLKVISKACLDTLTHITELCRIAEYCNRHAELSNTAPVSKDDCVQSEIAECVKDLASVDWKAEDRQSARVYLDGIDKDIAQALVKHMNVNVLWLAYVDVYISNMPYENPSGT